MEVVNDLGNDVVLAMLVEKKLSEKIDSKDVLSLISRIQEILEPVSAKDHSHTSESLNNVAIMKNSH